MNRYGVIDEGRTFRRRRFIHASIGLLFFAFFVLAPSRSSAQTIIAFHNGNWNASGTWFGGVPPGAGDTADIGTFTITLNANYSVGALTWGPGATLNGANGSLAVVNEISINPLSANAVEHLVSGTPGAVVAIHSQGTTNLFSPDSIQTGLTDDDTGTAQWDNQSGGAFMLNNSASILGSIASVFTNESSATLAHTGNGTSLVAWTFSNNGAVEVANGTLEFDGPVVQNDSANHTLTGGAWIVRANSTLTFNGSPTFTTIGASASVTLDGSGSTFTPISNVTTVNGTLNILGGRTFTTAGNLTDEGAVTVNGANSIVNANAGTLTIGQSNNGSLMIANGSSVTSNVGIGIIGANAGSNGTVVVTDQNSTWSAGSFFNVGQAGNASLTISNGGSVTSGYVQIAIQSSSNSSVLVTGLNSVWNSGGFIEIGHSGNGSLTIANGGNVTSDGGRIAGQFGSNSTVLVTDTNSTWNTGSSGLDVGLAATGSMTIANGGSVISKEGTIGLGANSTVVVTGANSRWDTSGSTLGVDNGILTITDGGNVTSTFGGYIGDGSGTNGAALITGANSSWSTGSAALNVGTSGNGTLTIANGGNVASGNSYIGHNPNSNGTVLVSGANSLWSTTMMGLVVGYSGNGSLTIANGGLVSLGNLTLAKNASSMGMVNLDSGGILQAGGTNGIQAGSGTYAFNWGGGTIRVTGSDLTTSINATLQPDATPSAFDTNGFNATWSGVISGNDSFSKIGAGTLIFSRNNTYSGITGIFAGTLQIGAGGNTGTLGTSNVTNNASLVFNRSNNYIYAGVISGNGTITKTGTGTLTLAGNNTYTGNTTISQGTVAIADVGAGSALGSGTVIVASTGTLAGTGNIGGTALVSGTLSPGSGSTKGLLTFDNSLTLSSSAIITLGLDGFSRGVTYDALNVNGNVQFDGTLNVSLDSGFTVYPTNFFDVFAFGGSVSGAFATLNLPALGGSYGWDTSQLYTIGRLAVVPEPGTYAALLGAAALVVVLWRRRPAGAHKWPSG